MLDSLPMTDLLNSVLKNAERQQPHDDSDYIGPDGLLYCGKCHTPKQCRVTWPGINGEPERVVTPPAMCQCEQAAYEQDKRERKQREDMETVRRLRSVSMMDAMFQESIFTRWEASVNEFGNTRQEQENKAVSQRNLKLCKRYATGFSEMLEKNQGLLMYGDVGAGKSFAAACICNHLLEHKVPVVMTSFTRILSALDSDRSQEQDMLSQLARAKLVVLDDLGAERTTDYALEKVYNVIDERYRAKLPMVLTTNLSLAQMQQETDIRYRRIYDRIFATCYPMEFRGDWRLKEAYTRYDEMREFLEGGT